MAAKELIDRYCAAWNEPDAARRAALLAGVWAPGATYTDPNVHAATAAELVEHIEVSPGQYRNQLMKQLAERAGS